MPPIVLQTELLQYTRPIQAAGERSGRALGTADSRPWWMVWKDNSNEILELTAAWNEYEAAFDRLHEHIENLVQAAYHEGIQDGMK
jgi:hypothetical protein